eukprot:tig00001292_g8038.t1
MASGYPAAARGPGGSPSSPAAPKLEHPLVFKVMRLARPSFEETLPVGWEPNEFPGDLPPNVPEPPPALFQAGTAPSWQPGMLSPAQEVPTDPQDGFGVAEMIQLPFSFGTIYIGETFSSYISVSNISNDVLYRVNIKIEMQSQTSRTVLREGLTEPQGPYAPGRSSDYIVHHELKEGGQHILVCTATYSSAEHTTPQFLRQFFKFQALSPLGLVCRARQLHEAVYAEASVSNTTQAPILLSAVRLDPAPGYALGAPDAFNAPERAGSEASALKPGEQKQYVFVLVRAAPASPLQAGRAEGSLVGRLAVHWRSKFGELGRLANVPVHFKQPPPAEVEVKLASVPPASAPATPSPSRCGGLSAQSVGPIAPGAAALVAVGLFAAAEGLHRLPPSASSSRGPGRRGRLLFDHLGHVLVEPPDAEGAAPARPRPAHAPRPAPRPPPALAPSTPAPPRTPS